jgi:fimbrial chaperone protein
MRALLCASLVLVLLASRADAAPPIKSLEVAPTTLELSVGEPGLLYVANHSDAPITVQIDIYDWKQSRDGDRLVLTDTAYVSPPLTTIAPGERQIVRVLAQPKPSGSETGYRLRVSELPDDGAKPTGVQVLLQFSVPVFVKGTKDDRAIAWTATAKGSLLEFAAQNDGARTLKLTGLRVSGAAGAPVDVMPGRVSYILPDATHAWRIDAPALVQAARIHVDGVDERSGERVSADIGIAR